ncbi:MAG: endospore germination permease [Bacillota bacterium]
MANRQFFFILFMMRTTILIALMPVLTTADTLQDGWASAVAAFFGAALLVAVIGGLAVRFPAETLVEYSQKLLGKWPGKLLSLVPLFAFLYMAATDIRVYGEALVTVFLTETPLAFIIGAMVFISALAAYAGIEVIGRSADLFFPLFLLAIIISLVAPLPQVPILIRNIEPVLARGAGPVLRGAITPIAVISQYMVLTMITPSTIEPKRVLRTALGALGASSAVLAMSALLVVITLGPQRAARSVFPFLSMIRAVQLSEFIERMEVLIVFAWGFGVFIAVAAFLFSGARGLAQVMGLKTYRPLIGPMAAVWVAMAVHAHDDLFQVSTLFQPGLIFPLAAVGFILLPMGVLWGAYLIRALLGRLHGAG